MNSSDWNIVFDNAEVGKRSYGQESLMSLGNGYLGWRGAPVWSEHSEDHYPGLYIAGVYSKRTKNLAGKRLSNECIANLPNPQLMRFIIDGKPIQFDAEHIIDRKSQIDFEHGTQTDKYTLRVDRGFISIRTIKYVDPINFRTLGFEGNFLATFDGVLEIESLIDGTVHNRNDEANCDPDDKAFDVLGVSSHLLLAEMRNTNIKVAIGAKTWVNGELMEQERAAVPEQLLERRTEISFSENNKVKFEKVIALASSNEVESPVKFVENQLDTLTLGDIRNHSKKYWKKVWKEADVSLECANSDMQRLLRLSVFHLRQAAQHQANQQLDASVGAHGLTGEGQQGHISWDEIFMVPYYAANEPETARDLLRYRIKRLQVAKESAKSAGEEGAMFPWQSGLCGDEQSQFQSLNAATEKSEADEACHRHHVNLAIVYNLFIYYQHTGDASLLNEGGLELLLETTKFWLNKAKVSVNGRYHIDGVIGPDEYHESYPEQEEPGICDNAYTNLMLAWSLNWLATLPTQPELDLMTAAKKTAFDNALFEKAHDVAENLYLDIDASGVIAQYAGYFYLKEVDFAFYKKKHEDIQQIAQLMNSDGLPLNKHKVAQQADMLMAVYHLGAHQVEKLVHQLNYELPQDWLRINCDYYLERTVHDSSLSRPIFSAIEARLGDLKASVDFLKSVIASDDHSFQAEMMDEGVHLSAMAARLKVVQNELAGVSVIDGKFSLAPCLPQKWRRLAFNQKFRGVTIHIEITNQLILLRSNQDMTIKVYGEEFSLTAGLLATFAIKNRN